MAAVSESGRDLSGYHPVHSFDELRATGVLWLINRAVLHPRGYALALDYLRGGKDQGEQPTGWSIHAAAEGETFTFELEPGFDDERFRALEALLEDARKRRDKADR